MKGVRGVLTTRHGAPAVARQHAAHYPDVDVGFAQLAAVAQFGDDAAEPVAQRFKHERGNLAVGGGGCGVESTSSVSEMWSVILPDVSIGTVEEISIVVQLVLEKTTTQGFLHFTLPCFGQLPIRESDLLDDLVDV